MARKYQELRSKMSPERRARNEARTDELLAEMPLHELRKAREMTQEALAAVLGRKQAAVSKMEHRTDVYVGTLRRYVEALGGELEIIARFNDRVVRINQFGEI